MFNQVRSVTHLRNRFARQGRKNTPTYIHPPETKTQEQAITVAAFFILTKSLVTDGLLLRAVLGRHLRSACT